jgi:hypothetical protein
LDVGLGAGIQFSTLPNDDEGSDQEHDMVYDDTPDHTADSGIEEDDGPPPPPPSLFSRDRGHRALTVTASDKTTGPLVSGVNTVLAILEQRKKDTSVLTSGNISVRDALRTKGDEAKRVILKELQQMLTLRVIRPVHRAQLSESQRRATIRSSMFLKAKNLPDGMFDTLKARLVAGGDQQDKTLYDELSSATVSTSSVFTLASIAAYEKRSVAVVDIAVITILA